MQRFRFIKYSANCNITLEDIFEWKAVCLPLESEIDPLFQYLTFGYSLSVLSNRAYSNR